MAQLRAAGFKLAGAWHLEMSDVGEAKPRLQGSIPKQPGVYVYVVDGVIRYVGSAQRGLATRVGHYQRSMTMGTAVRVRACILAELQAGRTVEMYVAFPTVPDWHGLPVDALAGLEEGLIRKIRPDWNKRGTALVKSFPPGPFRHYAATS